MHIRSGTVDDEQVLALLSEHMASMVEQSPPESVHALDASELQGEDITFWSVWDGAELLGCGALKKLDATHGEVKSMRTATQHLGKGVARHLLNHIIEVARERGYRRLSLETGSGPGFDASHALYQKFGFTFRGPFGKYTDDPFSRFMSLELK